MLARVLAVTAGMATSAAAMATGVTFTPILRTGQQAPGAEPGVTISTVGNTPVIGEGGHVVTDFVRLAGPGITSFVNDHIGYAGLPGSLAVFQRGGAPAGPLGPDVQFSNQAGGMKGSPNAAGDFIFMQVVAGAGVDATNDSAMFLRQGGSTSVLFREGSTLAAFPNGEIVAHIPGNTTPVARFLNDGTIVARVQMTGGPGGTATQDNFLSGSVASPALQLAWGMQPPGCSDTLSSIDAFTNMRNQFSSTGKFIAGGVLSGAPTTSNDAFWTGDASQVSLWLREGTGLPGLDPADVVVFGADFGYSINDSGQALTALRLQTGVGDTVAANDRILVFGTPGNLSVIAREGDQVPNLPAGVAYDAFTWDSTYNGGAVIGATLRGAVSATNDEVILGGAPGALSVMMREGDPAPGFPSGYTLGSFAMNATSVKMNQNGHVALTITVLTDTGAGVKAMYACAPGSAPQRVVAWDSVLEVAPGDLRVVRRSSFSVDNPGGINSLDQVPFVAEFTDGSTASMVASVSFAAGPSFALAAGPTISDTLGNGNGVLDPAESSIGVTLPVRNDGSVTATGVTATLISLTPTVTVQTASASYPDLASGASAANATPYVLNVSPSHPCGSSVTLRLTVTSAQGSNDTSLVVPTGSNYPGCAVFTLASPVVVSDASGNGNGNGIADPGESHIALTVPFTKSSGEGTSSGVTGTLTTTTPTATIITGTAAYPNINAGATQGNSTPFVLSLSPSHPCGAPVNLHLSLTADGGLGHAEQDLSIFGGVPALTNTTARTSVGASIPDASSTGVNVSFVVSGVNGPVIDVDFRFDGTSTSATATTTSTGLGHANVGDVVITLTSPGGISVILANHPGPDSSANNMRACTFDDGAATSIQSIGNPAGPITGSFQPFQPLSVFNGLSGSAINGTWTLNVADTVASIGGTAGGQGGFVRNASLLIRNAAVCVAPHCAADFNNSGGLEVQDIFDYLNAWFAGSAAADFNGGGLAVQDIFDYLNAWFAGC